MFVCLFVCARAIAPDLIDRIAARVEFDLHVRVPALGIHEVHNVDDIVIRDLVNVSQRFWSALAHGFPVAMVVPLEQSTSPLLYRRGSLGFRRRSPTRTLAKFAAHLTTADTHPS